MNQRSVYINFRNFKLGMQFFSESSDGPIPDTLEQDDVLQNLTQCIGCTVVDVLICIQSAGPH